LGNTAEAKNWEFLAPTDAAGSLKLGFSVSDNNTFAVKSHKLLIAKGKWPIAKNRIERMYRVNIANTVRTKQEKNAWDRQSILPKTNVGDTASFPQILLQARQASRHDFSRAARVLKTQSTFVAGSQQK
jgi:hypothetical protein